MPIHCVCPNGHALRVKDKLAGMAGKCPTCGADFVVPTADPAGVPVAPPATQERAAPPISVGPPAPPTPAEAPAEAVEWRMAWADGQQFGPTVPTIFAQWIAAGRVPGDALVWRTGWAEWKPAAAAAAELPAPLPTATQPPPLPQPGVTLPPTPPSPPIGPAPTLAPQEAAKAAATGAYLARKRQQARRRRVYTIALAVLCLILTAALVMLVSGQSASSVTP